ncbi:alpha/beta hydrolase [Asanoa sp. NPDC049573]|uniref:alpha/beta fold hydrolase n=1 Tax=Asanoa sp. NPDC049573 TaxID=3155396 RepID=UPI00342993DC
MSTLLLVPGGLWEEMDAERFWRRPGVVAALQRRGFDVRTAERPHRAPSWASEADHLAAALPRHPVTVLAGSNGCSAAVRLALQRPDRVERLLLAWPATAGDDDIDARLRPALAALGATAEVLAALLGGRPLRGSHDSELATLTQPVGVLPAVPDNAVHKRRTVDALLRILPQATELPGCPEAPRPEFPPHLDRFADAVADYIRR